MSVCSRSLQQRIKKKEQKEKRKRKNRAMKVLLVPSALRLSGRCCSASAADAVPLSLSFTSFSARSPGSRLVSTTINQLASYVECFPFCRTTWLFGGCSELLMTWLKQVDFSHIFS
jgi:hypothetical protein